MHFLHHTRCSERQLPGARPAAHTIALAVSVIRGLLRLNDETNELNGREQV